MDCANCGYKVNASDRFCGKCGAKLSRPPLESSVVSAGLEPCRRIGLEFAESSSATFPMALEAAKSFPTYSEIGEGKKRIFHVDIGWEDWEKALELIDHLKGWRNRWIYIDGEKRDWSEVLYFSYCFAVRRRSYHPERHCVEGEFANDVHPFGCVHSGLSLVWPASGWLQAGTFDSNLVFHFNKRRMKEIMEENLFRVRFCPALNLARALEVLGVFPDVANPKRDRRWEFDVYPARGGPPKLGVQVSINRGLGWIEKAQAFGVRASSRQTALSILAELAAKLRNTRLPAIALNPGPA